MVAELLGRSLRQLDETGYEREITAGCIHPTKGWPAWVESKCKELQGGMWDVEYRLKALLDARVVIDWAVETYNPFFGCRVGHLAWHGDRVVVVYREKHRTYAVSFPPEGTKTLVEVADEWMILGEMLTHAGEQPDLVQRLTVPDLRPLSPITAGEAKANGLLPPKYDWRNELNRRYAKPHKRT